MAAHTSTGSGRRSWCFSFALASLLAIGGSAWSAWQQTDKLTAADGEEGDGFGCGVAVDGNIAVVGACDNNASGYDSGAAYVFDLATGQELHKLVPDDGAQGDMFGWCVDVSGDIAIGGANGDDDAGSMSGSAYLFDVNTGQQLHKLVADDAAEDDQFGYSVAIWSDVAIVGSPSDDDGGSSSGSAYLFDVNTGLQLRKLTADDAAAGDLFGIAVAIHGDLAVVGAWWDAAPALGSGSAYIFDVSTGQQLHKLVADDGAEGDSFGFAVGVDGDIVIVGSTEDDDGGSASGSAYLFDATTGQQLHKLVADDAASGDRFGYDVAVSGGIALVGARCDDDGGSYSGSAYLFDVTTGQQIQKLVADDGAADDFLGTRVSIDSDTVIIGAPGDDDNGDQSGSAYVFEGGSPCPADINADNTVDVLDLLMLLAAWGNTSGPEDVNADGIVDVLDLLELLASWGPC